MDMLWLVMIVAVLLACHMPLEVEPRLESVFASRHRIDPATS